MTVELKELKSLVARGNVDLVYAAGCIRDGWSLFFKANGLEHYLTTRRSNSPKRFINPLPLWKLVDDLNIQLQKVPRSMTVNHIATRLISMMITYQVMPTPQNLSNIVPLVSDEYITKANQMGYISIDNKEIVSFCGDLLTDDTIFIMQLKGRIDKLEPEERKQLKSFLIELVRMGKIRDKDTAKVDSILESLHK